MAEHICDGQWRYYCEACSGLPEAGEKPMTDQDNLRDRIKRLVDETDDGDSAAQAIIDEFGLTVVYAPAWDGEPSMSGEPHRMSVATEQQHRGNVENVITAWKDRSDKPNLRVESRVVGKWEKQ